MEVGETTQKHKNEVESNLKAIFFICLCVEKLGFFSSFPGHSCKNIRDAGDSEGDGDYWIDPAKNGNPLRVYCDMTTDGGTNM